MERKKIEIEYVEFDPELYKKNLEENEGGFTADPDGIGEEKEEDENNEPSDANKPV